jgi:hypothetical protein
MQLYMRPDSVTPADAPVCGRMSTARGERSMADAAVRYVCRALGWLRCCSVSASGGVVVTVNIFPDIPALQREAAVPSATPTVPPSALGRCESNVAKSAEGGTASYPAVCRAHSQCERMDGCCVASCWLRWRVPSAAAIFVDRTAEAPSSPVLHRSHAWGGEISPNSLFF